MASQVRDTFYALPWVASRLWRRPVTRTPQDISPELFINTQVPIGYDFTAAYASDPVVPAEQYPPVYPYPAAPYTVPGVPMQQPQIPIPAMPSRPQTRPAQPKRTPQNTDSATAALNAQLMNILAGVGVGSLAGMGLGYLIDGTEGAFAGGLVGAGVGGAVSPYLLAKIKAARQTESNK